MAGHTIRQSEGINLLAEELEDMFDLDLCSWRFHSASRDGRKLEGGEGVRRRDTKALWVEGCEGFARKGQKNNQQRNKRNR